MGSPEVLDFDRLLAPISDDTPAGNDPREDLSPVSVYREIRAARSDARQAERRDMYKDEDDEESSGPPADWRPVIELDTKLLAEQAKDLEVTSLLTEALVRRNGLAGLRDGFRLARELCERFCDHLYPRPDEDGVLTLVAPLAGLNGEDADGLLIGPIGKVAITGGTTVGPFGMADYQMAIELERIDDPDKRARRMEQAGAVSQQMFDAAVAETSQEFVVNLLDDLSQCSEEFESLGKVLEERCGKDERGFSLAPPSSNIRGALRECRENIETIFRHLLAPAGEDLVEGEEGGGQVVPGGGKAVATREDAFRALLQIAEFFKRTEPHSPVSYHVEQAVRWGRMDLPELLEELIPDGGTRQQLYKLVGIRPPEK